MSQLNQLPAASLLLPIDATAAAPAIAIGGGATGSSGTGIYGDAANIKFSIGGVLKATIDTNGITASIASLSSQIVVLTSSASAGGAATEAMVLTGLTTSDVILSVSQKTPGSNSLPLLGYSTQASNALTAIWSADPGAGAVIVVAVRR